MGSKGFIGEVWFLDNQLIPNIGIDNAVKSWTGPGESQPRLSILQIKFLK